MTLSTSNQSASASSSALSYPLSPPAGCPDYVVDSVRKQCDGALAMAIDGAPLDQIEGLCDRARFNELGTLRRLVNAITSGDDAKPNGTPLANDWWVRWGTQTVTKAWEDAAQLARFRDALSSPDFSHVTSGHSVSPNSYHVYNRDPKSPSGCMHTVSADHKLPGVDAVMAAASAHTTAGGQRGSLRGAS